MVCECVPWGAVLQVSMLLAGLRGKHFISQGSTSHGCFRQIVMLAQQRPFLYHYSYEPRVYLHLFPRDITLVWSPGDITPDGEIQFLDGKVCTKDLLRFWLYVPSLSDVGTGEFNGIPQGDIDKMNG